jgi:hypothetical protein
MGKVRDNKVLFTHFICSAHTMVFFLLSETFMARNEDGMEVLLGISVSGVIVGSSGSHKFYPWREIVNVVNHKRNFSIECTDQSQNVNFSLKDSETGEKS